MGAEEKAEVFIDNFCYLMVPHQKYSPLNIVEHNKLHRLYTNVINSKEHAMCIKWEHP